ncbi:5-oxoprolinase subunit PxpB [Winogradskyella luteola]|uniref:5-oxoprolinase subunit PxpB n=1 Tax=Winogradskyella luteola TaxID=2828330 RepID=A0A9X1FAJ4_9FLAO|nr:5-oxoprolinase subunit PxpB [Winogradskyella luteola]MBV7270499.1 5-oxoprolinase subunit PxpB [Winogradskyella luteola]
MDYSLKYFQYNEHSILIEWPAIIDENILKSILNFKNSIQKKYIKQKVEVINSYNSILIIYNFTIDSVNDKFLELKSLYEAQKSILDFQSSIWEIPVCYNRKFGEDLDGFSKEKGLEIPELIKLHSEQIYTVFFIGFLPGFLYLGGLYNKLHLDRKATPNLNVKKGSVAIGGQQTGIYPQDSPGGWHIIGRTPIELFNANVNPPCFIESGDKIKFKPIDKSEYIDINERITKSSFQLKPVKKNV